MNKELPIIKEGVEELKHMLKREQIVGRSSVYKLFIFYKADRDQMVEKLLFFWVCIVIQLDVGSEIMNRYEQRGISALLEVYIPGGKKPTLSA